MSVEIAGLALAAVYEREVAASLDRIWENVLDWEHLPWLHRSSFLAIREVEAWPLGWRACVLLPHLAAPRPAWIEVRIDRGSQRYVTRTLAGVGQGTEIWTSLDPVEERRTRITVEFHLPFSGAAGDGELPRAGAVYTALYTRLWDEDETMMVRRQEVLDARGAPATRGGSVVPLGSVSSLRGQLPRVMDVHGGRIRVVAVAGTLCAHATVCPHRGGPLEEAVPDADGCIVCPWHGYRFDLRTGRSADGRHLSLPPAPTLREAGGEVSLVWDAS